MYCAANVRFRRQSGHDLVQRERLLLTKADIPDPRWPLLKSGVVHFDDGLCITEKSVIESVYDFSLASTA